MNRFAVVYRSSVGRKIAMAATGFILIGFVVFHMYGNLKVFQGAEVFNEYAEGLRELGSPIFGHTHVLWLARAVLLGAVVLHIVSATQLVMQTRAARRMGYAQFDSLAFSYASRTMVWGGIIILAFVVYHLMHLTFGVSAVHPDFVPGDVYHNFVAGFQSWPVSLAYAAAMIPLGLHLYHGIWSAFQTLGANHPRFNRVRRPLAAAIAIVVVLGNLSFPFAVLTGIVQ